MTLDISIDMSKYSLMKIENERNDLSFKEMEIALTHANEANEEARGNIIQYEKQISELQHVLDEECSKREHWRQQYIISEKKLTTMKANKEELIEKQTQVRNI